MSSHINKPIARGFLIGNLGFILALIAVAGIFAWPIYSSLWFVFLVAVSVTLAGIVVFFAASRKLSLIALFGILLAVFVVITPLIAYPEIFRDFSNIGPIWIDALRSGITGWKDLITLNLPVGTYRGLLVPAFIVFLVGSAIAFNFALFRGKNVTPAVLALSLMQLFGLIFGSARGSGLVSFLGPAVLGLRELILFGIFFAIVIIWLSWRSYYLRTEALKRAESASGVLTKKTILSRTNRFFMAFGMLAIAALVGLALTPTLLAERSREVLRSAIDPQLIISQSQSPLASYRSWFLSDYDTELFRISAEGELPERVRFVTLNHYDGGSYQVGDSRALQGDRFEQVPYRLTVDENAELFEYQVQLTTGLAPWLPLSGRLSWIDFEGDQRSAQADGFYYHAELLTAINLADLEPGAEYRVEATKLVERELSELSPLSRTTLNQPETVPEELIAWVESQELSKTGQGLEQIIDRLRARGYLSHSLGSVQEPEDSASFAWAADLNGYGFIPSMAGHNTARIGELFDQLLNKESRVDSADNAQLVAAIGDDEQFAVAIALIAKEFGFDSRVVLGTHLSEDSEQAFRIPACENGICYGKNLTAWVEIRGAEGNWVTVDSTPQYENAPVDDTELLQDPKNPTNVDAQKPSVIPPQQNLPEAGEQQEQDDEQPPLALSTIWPVILTISLWVLAIVLVLSPFWIIVLIKWFRTQKRKRSKQIAKQITGGWEEYLDVVSDLGKELPLNGTRTEQAAALDSLHGRYLAQLADRSSYSLQQLPVEAGKQYWALLAEDLKAQKKERGFWEKLGHYFSLKSYARHLQAARKPNPRKNEGYRSLGTNIGITLASQVSHLGRATEGKR